MHCALRALHATCVVCRYEPPTATFSSSQGITGSSVSQPQVKITATFDHAVTGVTAADFGLASSNAAVTYSTALSGSGKTWVLTATITGGHANTDFTVTMPQNSGAIVKRNAAGANNGFSLLCTFPGASVYSCGHAHSGG